MTAPEPDDGGRTIHLDGSLPASRLAMRTLLLLTAGVVLADLGRAIGAVDPDAAGRAMVGAVVYVGFAHRW